MNLKAAILKEHSKAQALSIVAYIGNDPKKFAELIALFLGNTYKITQRAAWVMSFVAADYPELIEVHLERIVCNLRNPVHDAVKRNTIRILSKIEIPEELLGEVTDICFGFLATKKEAVAVKIFSMVVLHKICIKEPDLQSELKFLIEEQMPFATAGFMSRGKKILKTLTTL